MPWQRRAAASPDASPSPAPGPGTDPVSPELLAWADVVDATSLSDRTAQAAERFLRDYQRMTLGTRREVALRLRSAIEAQISPIPPPTVASMDIIATVLSARREQLGY